MKLLELKQPSIIVVYGGGFQPFHEGHMSSYREAKAAFPGANFYVAASNVTTERPFEFAEKQFLAKQAGVKDHFVQVGTTSYVNDKGRKVTSTPLNPLEILNNFDKDRDILVIVRSERDPMKTTDTSYYQPWQGVKSAEPFSKHAYIYVTRRHDFTIAGEPVYSGSQVRQLYSQADDTTKLQILKDLYPHATSLPKIKQIFDTRLASIKEDVSDDEAGEVEKQRNLIPFPKGTSLVSVSDVYDWYKLGQVISDLDDANPKWFGQGAPETIIAFGSEEEEHKLMPLLKRLGLKIKDIDPQGIDEAVAAEDLFEYLRKIHKRWAIVSKREGRPLVYFKGEGKPSKEWVKKQERRINYFKNK